jgi:ribonuclease HII
VNLAMDLWFFEKKATAKGYQEIAGIDEAGRGPLAGPVVSAAVILPKNFSVADVVDSKKLTIKKRVRLYEEIYTHAVSVGVGIVDSVEIDRINILQASLLAMSMAAGNLRPQPEYLLIDGTFSISSELPQKPIVKGDALSISIAAASIVAKVTRDRLMEEYHKYYPQFGFFQHKGYPTRAHKEAIRKFGYCPIHRQTFRGVKEYL